MKTSSTIAAAVGMAMVGSLAFAGAANAQNLRGPGGPGPGANLPGQGCTPGNPCVPRPRTPINNTTNVKNIDKTNLAVAVAPGLAAAASGCVVVESFSLAVGYVVSVGGGFSKGRLLVDCKDRAEAETFVENADCRIRELGVNALLTTNSLLQEAKRRLYEGPVERPLLLCQIQAPFKGAPMKPGRAPQ